MRKKALILSFCIILAVAAVITCVWLFPKLQSKKDSATSNSSRKLDDSSLSSIPEDTRYEQYRISADQLSQMTDDELVENVMNHPYLTEVYVVNDPQIVIDKMPEISDAFAELLKRGSATERIMSKVRALYEELYVTKSADAESEINYDKLCLLLYYSKDCRNELQPDDLRIVENSSMIYPNN